MWSIVATIFVHRSRAYCASTLMQTSDKTKGELRVKTGAVCAIRNWRSGRGISKLIAPLYLRIVAAFFSLISLTSRVGSHRAKIPPLVCCSRLFLASSVLASSESYAKREEIVFTSMNCYRDGFLPVFCCLVWLISLISNFPLFYLLTSCAGMTHVENLLSQNCDISFVLSITQAK